MSIDKDTAQPEPWSRVSPERTRPDRRVGGFYRTAEGQGQALGGVPLTGVDDAVVAAVRMGYKVAEAQIERSARLAQRLRRAGDQAVGPDSERKSVDAAERLVFRTMMSGLTWLEGAAAAERGSPLKRLAEAEYRMLGSLFGLAPPETAQASRDPAAARSPARPAGADSAATGDAPPAASAVPALEIRHLGPDRRPVRVAHWEIATMAPLPAPATVRFYSAEQIGRRPLEAEFVVNGKGVARLSLATPRLAPPGLWRGTICNDEGLQLGLIEIVL
jgi:hypothetical protein